jgi:Legionella pneumophila major outer membrane protein precursor
LLAEASGDGFLGGEIGRRERVSGGDADMRMRIRRFLLIAGLLLLPSVGFAQNSYSVPPVLFTGPLSGPRPEDGGFYTGYEFVYYNTNRPLWSQQIAYRGFLDLVGDISPSNGPNTFHGTHATALSTNDVMGPGQDQPGWNIFIGWKFQGGVAVEIGWLHLTQVRYNAQANILPPNLNAGPQFDNTFLFSPVSNFTTDWAGAAVKLPVGSVASVFGIWNAASAMNISFEQRYDIYTINVRVPMIETENFRSYGLFGPRIVWIVDRFDWRTVSADILGNAGPDTTAVYTNMVSNRMTGVHFGCGNDWYLGSTPIGAFALQFDIEGGMYFDLVKTTANYNRADGLVSAGRSGRLSSLVPAAEAKLGLKWYVWEGISLEVGYDIQTYFNTIASPKPVDFNVGNVNPEYDHYFFRWFHGMHAGISFSF